MLRESRKGNEVLNCETLRTQPVRTGRGRGEKRTTLKNPEAKRMKSSVRAKGEQEMSGRDEALLHLQRLATSLSVKREGAQNPNYQLTSNVALSKKNISMKATVHEEHAQRTTKACLAPQAATLTRTRKTECHDRKHPFCDSAEKNQRSDSPNDNAREGRVEVEERQGVEGDDASRLENRCEDNICPSCQARFKEKQGLIEHLRTHVQCYVKTFETSVHHTPQSLKF